VAVATESESATVSELLDVRIDAVDTSSENPMVSDTSTGHAVAPAVVTVTDGTSDRLRLGAVDDPEPVLVPAGLVRSGEVDGDLEFRLGIGSQVDRNSGVAALSLDPVRLVGQASGYTTRPVDDS
jgi:hypothetical protein